MSTIERDSINPKIYNQLTGMAQVIYCWRTLMIRLSKSQFCPRSQNSSRTCQILPSQEWPRSLKHLLLDSWVITTQTQVRCFIRSVVRKSSRLRELLRAFLDPLKIPSMTPILIGMNLFCWKWRMKTWSRLSQRKRFTLQPLWEKSEF